MHCSSTDEWYNARWFYALKSTTAKSLLKKLSLDPSIAGDYQQSLNYDFSAQPWEDCPETAGWLLNYQLCKLHFSISFWAQGSTETATLNN